MKHSIVAAWGEPARRFALSSLFVLCAVPGAMTVAADASASRTTQLTQVPAAVTAGQAAPIAPLDGAQRLKLAINLTLRNKDALDSLVQQIYNPVSPLYRHYLSTAEFTEQFSPTQADYDSVVAWATSQGFTVRRTTPNRHIVDIEGTVDTVNRALHVQMESFRHPSESRAFFAPDREPTISLSVPVLQFTGLDNFTLPKPMLKRGDATSTLGPVPHAGGSGPQGEFLPSDMRAVYYGSGPLTGAGQTVGVFSFEGYNTEDVGLYYTLTGETPHDVPISNVLVNGFSGECGDCDDGEQVLDIVNVIGMAPGISQLLFYEGDSGPDVLNQMATDNIAKVLSCSWGSSDMGHVADPIYEQFQAQGQTFANATGDDGSYDSSSWLPPSANSYTLEVGGTDLTVSGPGGSWTGESAWSDSGGGFYAPAGYATPDYQLLPGVITATNGGSTAWRNDPDVSAEANFDNPTIIDGQLQLGYGGTSFAAPRWSGFIALVNEQSIANGGAPVGFVNPALYAIGTGPNVANDFHDPASGSNGGFHAVAGYDLVTGWGSPNGANLIGDLAGSTTDPGFVLSGYPANPSLTPGGSATTAVTVNVLNGFSDPVTLTTSALPPGLTATFDPAQTTSSSTLTFSADASAAIGTTSVTVTGTAGVATQITTLSVLVGNAPAADVTPAAMTFGAVVPLGAQQQRITVSNAQNSIPLTYSVAISAQSAPGAAGSSCSGGAVAWLTTSSGGTINGGQTGGIDVSVAPAGALALGTYTASICITTNDPTQPQIIVPVSMTIIAGPQSDTIFESSFETGETGTPTTGTFTFVVDQPVDDSVAGSALDLATGNYHGFDSTVDNFNPYDDGSGLLFYWYDDQLPSPFSHQVGGVASGGKYVVLQSGATIGPSSTFSRDSTTPADASNWRAGVDGYLGVAFRNSLTHQLNYGYIHLSTTAPLGFPVQVLDYGFDNTGAAVTIP